ncbi:MAG: hypothetical protein FJ100_23640, partial [Deltaproteobacteria bacterium]|nr:hypothetical protein [Deltaproteobacteria bacterium]
MATILTLSAACSEGPAPPSAAGTGPTCTKDLDCAQAVNLNKWRGKSSANPMPPCAEPFCKAGRCDTRAMPKDSLCEDGDALPCTSGQCDAAGKCNVPLVPLVDKDQCLIAGACHA